MNVELDEHVVVLAEPVTEFMGHFAPRSGGSEEIFVEPFSVCCEYDVGLAVVGCDGTNVNTGKHSGMIRRVEEAHQKPLHTQLRLPVNVMQPHRMVLLRTFLKS